MKTWKLIAGTLLTLLVCLYLASCGEEDYSTPTADALVNTTWTGKDSGSMYNQIIIVSRTNLTYIVRAENGEESSRETMQYTYNESDGTFRAWSGSFEMNGTINNAYMTLRIGDEQLILDKE